MLSTFRVVYGACPMRGERYTAVRTGKHNVRSIVVRSGKNDIAVSGTRDRDVT